jgi:hypothetical protein
MLQQLHVVRLPIGGAGDAEVCEVGPIVLNTFSLDCRWKSAITAVLAPFIPFMFTVMQQQSSCIPSYIVVFVFIPPLQHEGDSVLYMMQLCKRFEGCGVEI